MTRQVFVLLLPSLLFVHTLVHAQQHPREWIIGLNADVTKYYGDYTDDRFQSGGNIAVRHFYRILDTRTALYLEASISGYELDFKTTEGMLRELDHADEIELGAVNRTFIAPLQFQLLWRRLIGPRGELFLGGGLEIGYFQPYNHNGYPLPKPDEEYGKWELGIPLSVQFDYLLSDVLALNFHSTLHFPFSDYLDGVSAGTGLDAYLTAGIGFAYSFPAPDRDTDFDGLTDREETEVYRTDPENPDTDQDGVRDGEEIQRTTDPLRTDSDGDGLMDGEEIYHRFSNPLSTDTDGDGLSDAEEVAYGTLPFKMDTDGDNLNDQFEISRGTNPLNHDTDGDGLPDGMEANSSPLLPDTDADGLTDGRESAFSLRPYDEDYDNDGIFDLQEIQQGTDPRKEDTDNDGLQDYVEIYGLLTDPRSPDTDGDELADGIDSDPLGTGVHPQMKFTTVFGSLFKHERAVDETNKHLATMLHLIRCASPFHVRLIRITVYGQTPDEAITRAQNLEQYLEKMTGRWGGPPIDVGAETQPRGYVHARLEYLPR